MKIAIVQEWLTNLGGSERVTLALHELFPQATIFTSLFNLNKLPSEFKDLKVKTSFLQKIPFAKNHHQLFLPLMPYAFESFDFSNFDIVISSNHSCSKGIITSPSTLHICYCHTPTRYLWSNYHEYLKESQFNFLLNKFIPRLSSNLRIWDRVASYRPDLFIANSHYVAKRIKKYYKKEAKVIYPPVNTSFYQPGDKIENYYLVVSRLIPYKKVDLVVEAFNDLGLPLKIIGRGSEEKKLRKKAKANIEILSNLSDEDVRKYYSSCLAFIAPQEEDFGITTVEALASGRPVIAYRQGGATEIITEGITGIFFDEQTPQCLIDAIKKFKPQNYNSKIIRQYALKFDEAVFKKEIKKFIEEAWAEFSRSLEI